mgnify:CR=1 FL=1
MKPIAAILGLLQDKQQLFTSYLHTTSAMLGCGPDQFDGHVQKRGLLAEQIDRLDRQLAEVCLAAGEPLLLDAVKNKCDRGDLPREILPVFDAAQAVFSVINQVANLEPQVLLRMQNIQKELQERIKASNTKPKIARYLDTLDPTLDSGTLLHAESNKV